MLIVSPFREARGSSMTELAWFLWPNWVDCHGTVFIVSQWSTLENNETSYKGRSCSMSSESGLKDRVPAHIFCIQQKSQGGPIIYKGGVEVFSPASFQLASFLMVARISSPSLVYLLHYSLKWCLAFFKINYVQWCRAYWNQHFSFSSIAHCTALLQLHALSQCAFLLLCVCIFQSVSVPYRTVFWLLKTQRCR